VNAGITLSSDELQDVFEARANLQATKDKAKTDFYEQHWERYLRPYKTVAEFDAAHPNRQSILTRSPNEMPHVSSDDRLSWCESGGMKISPETEEYRDDPNVALAQAAEQLGKEIV